MVHVHGLQIEVIMPSNGGGEIPRDHNLPQPAKKYNLCDPKECAAFAALLNRGELDQDEYYCECDTEESCPQTMEDMQEVVDEVSEEDLTSMDSPMEDPCVCEDESEVEIEEVVLEKVCEDEPEVVEIPEVVLEKGCKEESEVEEIQEVVTEEVCEDESEVVEIQEAVLEKGCEDPPRPPPKVTTCEPDEEYYRPQPPPEGCPFERVYSKLEALHQKKYCEIFGGPCMDNRCENCLEKYRQVIEDDLARCEAQCMKVDTTPTSLKQDSPKPCCDQPQVKKDTCAGDSTLFSNLSTMPTETRKQSERSSCTLCGAEQRGEMSECSLCSLSNQVKAAGEEEALSTEIQRAEVPDFKNMTGANSSVDLDEAMGSICTNDNNPAANFVKRVQNPFDEEKQKNADCFEVLMKICTPQPVAEERKLQSPPPKAKLDIPQPLVVDIPNKVLEMPVTERKPPFVCFCDLTGEPCIGGKDCRARTGKINEPKVPPVKNVSVQPQLPPVNECPWPNVAYMEPAPPELVELVEKADAQSPPPPPPLPVKDECAEPLQKFEPKPLSMENCVPMKKEECLPSPSLPKPPPREDTCDDKDDSHIYEVKPLSCADSDDDSNDKLSKHVSVTASMEVSNLTYTPVGPEAEEYERVPRGCCFRCGAHERGTNPKCPMCVITIRMQEAQGETPSAQAPDVDVPQAFYRQIEPAKIIVGADQQCAPKPRCGCEVESKHEEDESVFGQIKSYFEYYLCLFTNAIGLTSSDKPEEVSSPYNNGPGVKYKDVSAYLAQMSTSEHPWDHYKFEAQDLRSSGRRHRCSEEMTDGECCECPSETMYSGGMDLAEARKYIWDPCKSKR